MRHSKGRRGRAHSEAEGGGRAAKYGCNIDAIMSSTYREKGRVREGEPQSDLLSRPDKLLTYVTTQCGTESSFCLDVCGASLMIFLAFTAIFSLMGDAASENCSRKGNEVVPNAHARLLYRSH